MSGVGLDGTPEEVSVESQGGDDNKPAETAAPVLAEVTKPEETGVVGPTTDASGVQAQKEQAQAKVEEKPAEEIEEYELEVDGDSPLSQEELDTIAAYAAKYNLSKEDAQDLVVQRSESLKAVGELAALRSEYSKNTAAVLAMPEFAADKKEETMQTIREVVSKFGDDDFAKLISGPAGSHPGLVKLVLKIGNSMKSDDFAGRGAVTTTQKEVNPLQNLYPDFFKEQK